MYMGRALLDRRGLFFNKQKGESRYICITDSSVLAHYGEQVQQALREKGLKMDMIDFPPGEASKDITTCLRICDQLMAMGADRQSALIALGAGGGGDAPGF